jgi:hypothetical protein
MSKLLRGNFDVKRDVAVPDSKNPTEEFNTEFRKKALESIGGSMVFVEREKLFWDPADDHRDQ